MSKIYELRDQRAKEWEAAKAFLDTRTQTDGTLSAEDAATYDKMEQHITELGNAINRAERAEEMDRQMAAVEKPVIAPIERDVEDEKKGTASKTYSKAFWTRMRNKNISHEVYAALQEDTNSEGGYLVPDEFEHTLVDALADINVMRQLATRIQTSSGDRIIPVVTSHGTASWKAEEASYAESDDAFGQVTLSAHKLTTLVKVSEELLYDSAFDLEAYMSKEFARRFAVAEEAAFVAGNGTGQPTGVIAGTAAKTTANGTAITADEIIDLIYSLRAPYRKNAKFLMNDSTIAYVRKLKDGNGVYLWQPALQMGEPDRLMGYPIYTSVSMPTIAAGAKTVAFGDFSYYWIADREAHSIKRLDELYAATGQVGFIAHERVDGKLILAEAVKILAQHA